MFYWLNPRKMMILIAAAAVACTPFIRPVSEEARQKNEQQALTMYEAGVKDYKAGDYPKALERFSQILKQYSRTGVSDQAGYMSALVQFRLGQYKKTIGHTKSLLRRPLEPKLWQETAMLDGEAHAQLGEWLPAARSLLWLCVKASDPGLVKIAGPKAKEILAEKLAIGELERLHREFGAEVVDGWIAYHLGARNLKAGSYDAALSALQSVINRFPGSDYTAKAQQLLDVARLAGPTGRIGLLLALTGQFSTFGRAVREGVEYAFSGQAKFKLEVYDTGSTAEGALAGAAELIRNRRVDAIIGPVSSREALAVAPFANACEVSLVVPTATEPEIADTGPWVFQLNSYPYVETRRIAEYAVSQLRYKRFGVFYPQGSRGEGLAQAFGKVVAAHGGKVVATHAFDPEAKTFKDEVWEFRSSQPEAIFIPATRAEIELIAPYLDYLRIRARVLGLDDFDDFRVARMSEKCMEGAVFVAPPSSGSGEKKIDEFYYGFKKATGRDPSDLAALGNDAAVLLLSALAGTYSRSGLAGRLRSMVKFEGVAGKLSFAGAETIYKIYTIKDGKIEEVQS